MWNFFESEPVTNGMSDADQKTDIPLWLTVVGSCSFILLLGISAFWERDIRWLHFFQAWMYIAIILLAISRKRWGYFIGISAAGLWNYSTVFANTFFYNGLQQFSRWMHSGQLERPDLLLSVPAWISNLTIIVGCAWAYLQLPRNRGVTSRHSFPRSQ
jgi:hypothetical protein